MSYMPLVSVIVPAFNTEGYLRECLDSVLAQTLADIEVICVNDGSVDGTLAIMEEYAGKHANVRVIDQVNRGLSAARNAGMQSASGKYLFFMDSDDKVEPCMLEELTDRCEKYQLDVLFFSGDGFFESEALREKHKEYEDMYLRTGTYPPAAKGSDLFTQLRKNDDYVPSACLQLLRREFLLQQGISFENGLVHEDNLFTFQVIFRVQRAGCVNDIYYHRRVREDSLMTIPKSSSHLRGYFICLLKQMAFADTLDITEFETKEEIRRTLDWLYGRMRNVHAGLSSAEKQKFLRSLTDGQRYLFEVIVEKEFNSRKKIRRLQNTLGYRAEEAVKRPLRKVRDALRKKQ